MYNRLALISKLPTILSTECVGGESTFPKIIGTGVANTSVDSFDLAASGEIIIGIDTEDESIAGVNAANSKVVAKYDN